MEDKPDSSGGDSTTKTPITDTACISECSCGEYHLIRCPVAKALRNCWCTPKWIAKLIGEVDLDPCSNERSHVRAMWKCVKELGCNGLHRAGRMGTPPGTFWWGHPSTSFLAASATSTWRV